VPETWRFCACNLQHFCEFCTDSVYCIRKKEIQIDKHSALALSDISINRKITTNSDKCRHLLHRPGTWKAEAELKHSQFSAKHLISFTPNCFAWAAAVPVVSIKLLNNSAKMCYCFPFLHQFFVGRPILCKILQVLNRGIPGYLHVVTYLSRQKK